MKKKFSKERFYKRLEAQNIMNPDATAFASAIAVAQFELQKALQLMSAMTSSTLNMLREIKNIKEHGTLPEKPKEITIQSGECRVTPEQIANLKEHLNRLSGITN